jgi:hypothetical protein
MIAMPELAYAAAGDLGGSVTNLTGTAGTDHGENEIRQSPAQGGGKHLRLKTRRGRGRTKNYPLGNVAKKAGLFSTAKNLF